MAADLPTKLQIKPGQRLAVLHAPAELADTLAPQLAGLELTPGEAGATDAVLCFVTRQADVPGRLGAASALLRPGGLLWLAYPKGGARAGTDLNRDRLWEAVSQGSQWRPVRQIAIDELWSALRFRPADEVGR